jgi:RimJ/RimL family protein N-acetyltransferase
LAPRRTNPPFREKAFVLRQLLKAETAVANLPSQAVLRRNGFCVAGQRMDAEDGALLCWELGRPPTAP